MFFKPPLKKKQFKNIQSYWFSSKGKLLLKSRMDFKSLRIDVRLATKPERCNGKSTDVLNPGVGVRGQEFAGEASLGHTKTTWEEYHTMPVWQGGAPAIQNINCSGLLHMTRAGNANCNCSGLLHVTSCLRETSQWSLAGSGRSQRPLNPQMVL